METSVRILVLMVGLQVVVGCMFHNHHSSLHLNDEADQETDMSSAFTQFIQLRAKTHLRAPAVEEVKPPSKKIRKIDGRIKLNGQLYQTSCECEEEKEKGLMCEQPTQIRVRKGRSNAKNPLADQKFPRSTMKTMLGGALTTTYGKSIQADASKTSFGCIDGRSPEKLLGTPGGDFGEFLMAMNEFERLNKKELDADQVKQIFVDFLNWKDRPKDPFYYHTDEAAVKHLQENLHVNGRTGTVLALDLQNPDEALKPELLKDLTNSLNQGCYFIKALLDNPGRFYIRKKLVEHMLHAFYNVLWDRSTKASDGTELYKKLYFASLSGVPDEKAFIDFRGSESCEQKNMAVPFAPLQGKDSVYVSHSVAANSLRSLLARFFALKSDLGYGELLKKFERRGRINFLQSAELFGMGHQGGALPFFTVIFE